MVCRFKFILISLCLLVSSGVYADYKKIDIAHDPKTNKISYWVIFVSRKSDIRKYPGHAYVVWGKRNNATQKWTHLKGYGLYPDNKVPVYEIALGTVPGNILEESVASVRSGQYDGLAVKVTEQMFHYTKTNITAIKTGKNDYNILSKNCINFTKDVLNALGLNSPDDTEYMTPWSYMEQLRKIND